MQRTLSSQSNFSDVNLDKVQVNRLVGERVFANKNLDFEKIKAVGFDMDYTIAPYCDEYYKLQYDLTVKNLINIYKYPEEIQTLEYDPEFAVKGLFLDTKLGNVLKVDQFGYVHLGLHGKTPIDDATLRQFYPDKTIPITELENSKRYYLQSSAFSTPLITLYATLIDYFERQQALSDPISQASVRKLLYYNDTDQVPKNQLLYINLFDDINYALYLIHGDKAEMKQMTIKNPGKYVIKSPNLTRLFKNLKDSGKIIFLLTNSSYEYTHAILNYLFDNDYHKYFDYIITDARKPSFFTGSTSFREVVSGKLGLSSVGQSLQPGHIYAGGNYRDFLRILGVNARDMLYCGDHIVGDTGATRDQQMRTLFVCPELAREMEIQERNSEINRELMFLESQRSAILQLCCENKLDEPPAELRQIDQEILQLQGRIDLTYNRYFGSIFNTTWSKTWLSYYMQQNADLYTGELVNLVNYSPYHRFMANYLNELAHIQVKSQEIEDQEAVQFRLVPSNQIQSRLDE